MKRSLHCFLPKCSWVKSMCKLFLPQVIVDYYTKTFGFFGTLLSPSLNIPLKYM